jgi:hypothetical protein
MDRLGRIDMLIELLSKEPDDVFLNYALGIEYAAELNLTGAEAQFKKTLQIDADHIASYYQLGKLFESQLKNEEGGSYVFQVRTGKSKTSKKQQSH